MNHHKFVEKISVKSKQVSHLRLINNAIPLEAKNAGLLVVITNRQLDLPADLETFAAHATLY